MCVVCGTYLPLPKAVIRFGGFPNVHASRFERVAWISMSFWSKPKRALWGGDEYLYSGHVECKMYQLMLDEGCTPQETVKSTPSKLKTPPLLACAMTLRARSRPLDVDSRAHGSASLSQSPVARLGHCALPARSSTLRHPVRLLSFRRLVSDEHQCFGSCRRPRLGPEKTAALGLGRVDCLMTFPCGTSKRGLEPFGSEAPPRCAEAEGTQVFASSSWRSKLEVCGSTKLPRFMFSAFFSSGGVRHVREDVTQEGCVLPPAPSPDKPAPE